MNNGQMDCGNENPTQHLPWWLRETTKKPQSGWPAPGFEPGTSRMRVSCVTTEPPRSVNMYFIISPFLHTFEIPALPCRCTFTDVTTALYYLHLSHARRPAFLLCENYSNIPQLLCRCTFKMLQPRYIISISLMHGDPRSFVVRTIGAVPQIYYCTFHAIRCTLKLMIKI